MSYHLVCGATGFIGRNIIEFLAQDKSLKIRAVYHNKPPFDTSKFPNVEWVYGDLCNNEHVSMIMDDVSVVIQAAATTSGSKDITSSPYLHVTDNAIMNSLLLRQAYHSAVSKFIFFSCTVMYHSSDIPLREDDFDPSIPLNQKYFGVASTKLYIESLLDFYARISDMTTVAIRHSNVYGQYDKYDLERSHVFGASVSKVMAATDQVEVWGSGIEERDLIHVDDLMSFLSCILSKPLRSYNLFNCGGGSKISVASLVQLIIDCSGKNLSIVFNTSKPSIKTSVCLDNSKASEILGWFPQISLESGINKTLRWYSDNVAH